MRVSSAHLFTIHGPTQTCDELIAAEIDERKRLNAAASPSAAASADGKASAAAGAGKAGAAPAETEEMKKARVRAELLLLIQHEDAQNQSESALSAKETTLKQLETEARWTEMWGVRDAGATTIISTTTNHFFITKFNSLVGYHQNKFSSILCRIASSTSRFLPSLEIAHVCSSSPFVRTFSASCARPRPVSSRIRCVGSSSRNRSTRSSKRGAFVNTNYLFGGVGLVSLSVLIFHCAAIARMIARARLVLNRHVL